MLENVLDKAVRETVGMDAHSQERRMGANDIQTRREGQKSRGRDGG